MQMKLPFDNTSYCWPCLDCGQLTQVSWRTHGMLRSKALSGVRCDECLAPTPPDEPIILRGPRAVPLKEWLAA